MAAPFCKSCGAAVVEGTRFCVKCGQPVAEGAAPPPPPPPAQPFATLPLPRQTAQFPAAKDPSGLYPPPPPVKEGAGAGVWIAIFGALLLMVGAGLWFYTTHIRAESAVRVAPVAAPAPSPTPEVIPPNPDFAKDAAKPEVIPPNPDFAPPKAAKEPAQPRPQPVQPKPTAPAAPAPAKAASQTSGTLHAAVEVAQNGEVVFENLPGGRLKFTFDHDAWRPTIHRQANGTQTLIMRSLKPGIQRTCEVQWEIVE